MKSFFVLLTFLTLTSVFAEETPVLIGATHEVSANHHPELVCYVMKHFANENFTHVSHLRVQVVSGLAFQGKFESREGQVYEVSGLYHPWKETHVSFNKPILLQDEKPTENSIEIHPLCEQHIDEIEEEQEHGEENGEKENGEKEEEVEFEEEMM